MVVGGERGWGGGAEGGKQEVGKTGQEKKKKTEPMAAIKSKGEMNTLTYFCTQ